MPESETVMARRVKIEQLSDAVMEELNNYRDVVDQGMRAAVREAGKTVQADIKASAPKQTGGYSRSWAVKNTKQNSHALEVTVYSRNRYQLTHLLEFGHAKRNGGRTRAQVHIAPAEEKGIRQLEEDIKRSIRNG